jgi:two-component system, LytTR family, response regulator LytT
MKSGHRRLPKNPPSGRSSSYRRDLDIPTPIAPWSSAARVVARRRGALVFLDLREIWAFEAAERLTFVHSRHGTFDIDVSLAAIEASAGAGFTRVHRNWLVNRNQIKALERSAGNTILFVGIAIGQEGLGIQVPVARTRAASLRDELLANAIGVRR